MHIWTDLMTLLLNDCFGHSEMPMPKSVIIVVWYMTAFPSKII